MIPHWYQTAVEEIGVEEITGPRHSRRVLEYHEKTGLKATDDETSWCGAFVGWCMAKSNVDYSGVFNSAAGARSWLGFGKELKEPSVGCVIVLWRESRNSWKGHVGFFAGWANASKTKVKILGGNQSNSVRVSVYDANRILGYRWPAGYPLPVGEQPLSQSNVIRGAGTALAGTVTAVGANSNEIVKGLQEADKQLSVGTTIGFIAAAVVILGLVVVIWSRSKGGKEQQSLATPLKRGS